MNQSVSISKITPPELPQILYRPRLLNLLEKNKDKKLILILGQAAQGKTTLVASYVKTSKIPSAWLNLDKQQSNPVNLFYLFVQSLQHGLKSINFYNLFPNSEIMGSRAKIHLFRQWMESVFKLIPFEIQIVIDGLDRLSSDALAFKFLNILVDSSPPLIRFIMTSREIPPEALEFQHLKIKGQASVITNEDLAFTPDETKEFFQTVRRISFTSGQLKKIHLATDGWVGGLILISESLSRFPELEREKFISQELPDHFRKEVFQFFGKEILSSQPKKVQNFLVKSSLIDIIDPAFMKDLLGIENAEDILREHVRKNLFVQCFYDEKKGWLFRYHHSFRAFLKAKFKTTLSEEERQALLLKAGVLYEQRNELENSVKYFLEAKAYVKALPLIERLGMDLLKSGRKDDLLQWISELPQFLVQEDPWLLLFYTMSRRYMAGKENVIALEKAYHFFKRSGNVRGHLLSLAQLIDFSIHTGVHLIPIDELLEEGETVLRESSSNQYQYEKARLWFAVGIGYILISGNIRKGIWTCQNAYLLTQQLRDISLQVRILAILALGFVFVGEYSSADETLIKIDKTIEKSLYSEPRALRLMVSCVLANHQGDFIKCERLVEKIKDEVEKYGFIAIYPWIYEISGYLKLSHKAFSEAEEIAKQYLDTVGSSNNAFFKGLALRLLGLVYLNTGDFGKAREMAEQSIKVLSSEFRSIYGLYKVKLLLGLILCQLKDYQRAEEECEEALRYFYEMSCYDSLAETHFVIALIKFDIGKNEEASSHLRDAFKIAEERDYQHFYILGSTFLARACFLALELNVEGVHRYAIDLLSGPLASAAEEELKNLSDHLENKIIIEKVREIRRKIHRSKVPPLRIETLGSFKVIRGDSPIEEDQWDRIQPKQLLKAMVSYGAQKIPKEILIDELWPEERPRAAEKNFKTALQRLRKSLEPFIHKDFSSSYIHLHDNIVFLDPELCRVDVDQFLSLLKMGDENEKRGDMKGAISCYTDAAEIYKGDFVPEELYAPWVDKMREDLRGKYIELLNKMAKLYERQGALKKAVDCYKRAIHADPLLEEPYQKLMTLYSSKGMYNEALRTYEACKITLKKELKTIPDPLTTAIYKKVLEKAGSSRPTKRKGSNK